MDGKKIMWVEDDSFLSDIVAKKLAAESYNLVYVRNGAEAIEMAEKEMPDIIMLDILLPDVNGFDVLQKFKSNPKTQNIPVIILSNLDQHSDLDKGKELGAAGYMVKATSSLDQIMAKIKEVLK